MLDITAVHIECVFVVGGHIELFVFLCAITYSVNNPSILHMVYTEMFELVFFGYESKEVIVVIGIDQRIRTDLVICTFQIEVLLF